MTDEKKIITDWQHLILEQAEALAHNSGADEAVIPLQLNIHLPSIPAPDDLRSAIQSNFVFQAHEHLLSLANATAKLLAGIGMVAPTGQEYVDPYLFETGHFESRAEYEELSRTVKIKPRIKPQ